MKPKDKLLSLRFSQQGKQKAGKTTPDSHFFQIWQHQREPFVWLDIFQFKRETHRRFNLRIWGFKSVKDSIFTPVYTYKDLKL